MHFSQDGNQRSEDLEMLSRASKSKTGCPALRMKRAVAGLIFAVTGALNGQVKPIELIPASPPASYGYTEIAGLRELLNGNLLLLDRGDRAVYLVNLKKNTRTQIGRIGSGPNEYILPDRVLPLATDSTGILDVAAHRVLVIGTRGPTGFRDARAPSNSTGVPSSQNLITFSDTLGWFYARAQPIRVLRDNRLEVADSFAIERWTQFSRKRDTIALLPFSRASEATVIGGIVTWPVRRGEAFPAEIAWTVSEDGQLAVVYPAPYRIDLITSDGRFRRGPVLAYRAQQVTDAHKQEWLALLRRPKSGLMQHEPGGPVTAITIRPRARDAQGIRWPLRLPSFIPDQIRFDLLGRLWVQRYVAVASHSLFDVIGENGSVLFEVSAPSRSRLVGFGRGLVFLVRQDADDVEWLQAFRLPQ